MASSGPTRVREESSTRRVPILSESRISLLVGSSAPCLRYLVIYLDALAKRQQEKNVDSAKSNIPSEATGHRGVTGTADLPVRAVDQPTGQLEVLARGSCKIIHGNSVLRFKSLA